jgi:hypothetical protein
MRFNKLPESVRARITMGLFFASLVASILAGAADIKWY